MPGSPPRSAPTSLGPQRRGDVEGRDRAGLRAVLPLAAHAGSAWDGPRALDREPDRGGERRDAFAAIKARSGLDVHRAPPPLARAGPRARLTRLRTKRRKR